MCPSNEWSRLKVYQTQRLEVLPIKRFLLINFLLMCLDVLGCAEPYLLATFQRLFRLNPFACKRIDERSSPLSSRFGRKSETQPDHSKSGLNLNTNLQSLPQSLNEINLSIWVWHQLMFNYFDSTALIQTVLIQTALNWVRLHKNSESKSTIHSFRCSLHVKSGEKLI